MPGMRQLAYHVIEVAKRHSIPVTNLQLQKVMFFALGLHLNLNGIDDLAIETYDMPFEKWQFGPTVPGIYYAYNLYRNRDITESYASYSDHYASWDKWIVNLLKVNVSDLIQISCTMSAWADYKEDILTRKYVRPYTLEEIHKDFLQIT